MCIPEKLKVLESMDGLQSIRYDQCPAYLHKDHRWVLCLLWFAQEKGWLPRPCTLIMFDAHHDRKNPRCIDKIKTLRATGINFDNLHDLCRNDLSPNDDDWVIGGMELGLIGDAVVFGIQDRGGFQDHDAITDHLGMKHTIILLGYVLSQLEYQGDLSDSARWQTLLPIWDILGWSRGEHGRFEFKNSLSPILLDFDLDCFVINWGGYILPWPDEVFSTEFRKSSEYRSTEDWTGASFVQALAEMAGMITICTEPSFCGGNLKVHQIIERFNRFIFDNQMEFLNLSDE